MTDPLNTLMKVTDPAKAKALVDKMRVALDRAIIVRNGSQDHVARQLLALQQTNTRLTELERGLP